MAAMQPSEDINASQGVTPAVNYRSKLSHLAAVAIAAGSFFAPYLPPALPEISYDPIAESGGIVTHTRAVHYQSTFGPVTTATTGALSVNGIATATFVGEQILFVPPFQQPNWQPAYKRQHQTEAHPYNIINEGAILSDGVGAASFAGDQILFVPPFQEPTWQPERVRQHQTEAHSTAFVSDSVLSSDGVATANWVGEQIVFVPPFQQPNWQPQRLRQHQTEAHSLYLVFEGAFSVAGEATVSFSAPEPTVNAMAGPSSVGIRHTRAVQYEAFSGPVSVFSSAQGAFSVNGTASVTWVGQSLIATPSWLPEYPPDSPRAKRYKAALIDEQPTFGVIIDIPVQSWLPDYPNNRERAYPRSVNPVAAPVVPPGITPTAGRLSFGELETPNTGTRGRISWTEVETPSVLTRGRVSFAEVEAPFVATRGRASFTELEVPTLVTRGLISWVELSLEDIPVGGYSPRIGYSLAQGYFIDDEDS